MGVILYEMLYKKGPIRENSRHQHMENLRKGKEQVEFGEVKDIDPKLIELVKKMLVVKKEDRIKWGEILTYIYSNFDFLIYKVEQILRHQIALAKMQCLAIEFLRSCKDEL